MSTASFALSVLLALSKEDFAAIQRVMRPRAPTKDDAERLRAFLNAVNQGASGEADTAFAQMPKALQTDRSVLLVAKALAKKARDGHAYMMMARMLAERHGSDPALGKLLLDYYTIIGDFDTAEKLFASYLRSIDVIDSSTVAIQAMLAGESDVARSLRLFEQAAQLNPRYEFAYWMILYFRVELGDYAAANDAASVLTDRFSASPKEDEVANMPKLLKWRSSQEYRAWQRNR